MNFRFTLLDGTCWSVKPRIEFCSPNTESCRHISTNWKIQTEKVKKLRLFWITLFLPSDKVSVTFWILLTLIYADQNKKEVLYQKFELRIICKFFIIVLISNNYVSYFAKLCSMRQYTVQNKLFLTLNDLQTSWTAMQKSEFKNTWLEQK